MVSPETNAATLIALAVMVPLAWIFGTLATRLRQPAVLGELLAGVGLAALYRPASTAEVPLAVMAELGAVLLLFEIGLETRLGDLARVGGRATLVAIVGVAAPSFLGYAAARWLVPEAGPLTWWCAGATLCATSVGITARVLRDLGREASPEARIVLGAAVIDDVLGLLVLSALVSAARGELGPVDTAIDVVKAVGFLAFAALVLPRILARLPRPRSALPGLSLCFAMAALAHAAGLAAIVGGFAAGVAIATAGMAGEAHGTAGPWDELTQGPVPLRVGLRGLTAFLVPIFFVQMGRQVELSAALSGAAPWLLVALTLAAVAGKIASGAAAPRGTRWTVGIAMIPRGEVGLIFAGMGRSLGIADAAVTSTLILVVLATTLIGPPLLRWRLRGD